MIHLFSCTGGSASTIGPGKRRAATASCKTCGGKPVINGKGSSSSSLFSTVLELNSLIKSDLSWTKVSKGYRSSSRRPRRSVEVNLKAGRELVNKDSKELEMPVSESEKWGVSVLGCRFSEKAEHVPIKKRRFLFKTPSPPPKTPSPRSEGTERHAKIHNTSGLGFQLNPNANCLHAAPVSAVDLGQTDIGDNRSDGRRSVKASERIGEDEDFSGISILAAAACSNSLGGDVDCVEGSGVVSSGRGSLEVPINVGSKEDLVKSANMSSEGTGSCISTVPSKGAASFRTDDSSLGKYILDGSSSQVHSAAAPQVLLSKKNERVSKTLDSSARDDRLHWDLNTVMDAWEHPFDCQRENSPTDVVDSNLKYAEDEKHGYKKGNSEGRELGRELGGIDDDIGNALIPVKLKSLAHELQESKMEEHNLDGRANISRLITFQEKLLSSEIDSAPNVVVKETQLMHNQEVDSSGDGSLSSVPGNLSLAHPTSTISAKCVNLNCKGINDLSSCCEHAGMDSSMDDSLPPGFDHLMKMHVSADNFNASSTAVGCRKNIHDPITEEHNLSLTMAFPENGACESGNILNEDDGDAGRKSGLTNDGIAMKNFLSGGTGLPQGNELLDDIKENAVVESDEGGLSQSTCTKVEIPFLMASHQVAAENTDQPADVSSMHDNAEPDPKVNISAEKLPSTMTLGKSMTLLTEPSCLISHDEQTKYSNDLVSCSNKGTLEVPLDNGFGSDISQGDILLKGGNDKLDELSVEYDSQYEDGELRESSIHTWEGYEGENGDTEYGPDNKGTCNDMGIVNLCESSFQYGPEVSSKIRVADAGSGRGSDVQSSVPCLRTLSEKVNSGVKGSGSGPGAMIDGNGNNERQDNLKDASQSVEWKMNLSRWDLLPETRRSSSGIVTNIFRESGSRKISSGYQKDEMQAEDMETKVDGSRLYRRESMSRIGGPSSRDAFRSRARFPMQGCRSNDTDDANSRSERESGAFRSFGRGRYSPYYIHARGRGGDNWAHSPESDRGRKRHRSPSNQGAAFRRPGFEDVASDDKITKGSIMEPSDVGRQTTNASSYVMRRSFRSRSPTDRQDGFRARMGMRLTGDTSHDRFATIGRGRSVRYGSRFNGGGPRGRYHGPASDDCGELSDYSHAFPRRRRCFSPIERRGNPYAHRRSISRSPSRSRTRSPIGNNGFRRRSSRSPNFRSDARMRRPRSPNLRRGFEADNVIGFMSGPRNHTSPPPNSRWSNYKQRSSVFDRRSPGRINPRGERFSFYESSRKTKPNEYNRSGHPGRFSELNGFGRGGGPRYEGNDDDRRNHGYRRGLMRGYDMDGAVKRFRYDEEDGFGSGYDSRDKDASEFHGRGNPKPYGSRVIDYPRRSREDRDPLINRTDGKDRDWKDNTDSTSIGVREGDQMKRENPKLYSNEIDSRIRDFPRSREDYDPLVNQRDGKDNADSISIGVQEGDQPKRGNPKSYSNEIDSSIGDFPRSREDRDSLVNRRDGNDNGDSMPIGVQEGDQLKGGSPTSYSGEIDSRISDFPTSREDGDPLINRRDGNDNADSISIEVREGDEDVASSKPKPS